MSADRPREESTAEQNVTGEVSRRTVLRWGALAGAGASISGSMAGTLGARAAEATESAEAVSAGVEEVSIAQLQARMTSGQLSSVEITRMYLNRITTIDRAKVNSIVEVNPQALAIANTRDRERRDGHVRGPLHGIPIVLKENIDTGDRMQTTAGSLALLGPTAPRDATVAARLRAAGAVILGKANLSEWANFRSFQSSSGWSGRGGQTNNPYFLERNPCGSSSGSGASTASSFTAAALATETDGSIVCPASLNGVVGIKPTLGLTSRAGVIPISHSQDTVGPHGRTVADAAAVLGALVGVDPRDPATAASAGHFFTDYTQFLNPDGLRGARIGVARDTFTGYSPETDAIFEAAIETMRDAGAVIVDPADIPTAQDILADPAELIVLIYEFKRDIAAYLATRTGLSVHTLADLIAFNNAHAAQEMKWFGQELFELTESDPFTEQDYNDALVRSHSLSREQGIDAALLEHNLDALVAPTGSPAWPTDLINGDHFLGASSSPAAMAGYPLLQINAGYSFGLPVGISFMGTAWSEPKLIKIASGFEHVSVARHAPKFLRGADASGRQPAGGHSTAGALSRRLANLLDRLSAQSKGSALRLHSL
jgi:amidase